MVGDNIRQMRKKSHQWARSWEGLGCVHSFFALNVCAGTLAEVEERAQNPNQQLQLLLASADGNSSGQAGVQSLGILHMPLLHNGPIRQLDLDLISSLLPHARLSCLYSRTNLGRIVLGDAAAPPHQVFEQLLQNQDLP